VTVVTKKSRDGFQRIGMVFDDQNFQAIIRDQRRGLAQFERRGTRG
jgi:hypothetical protein